MELLLPALLTNRLRRELRRRGRREIGGVLMGEHLGEQRFLVADLTVQHAAGDEVCFTRNLDEHREQLREFFDRTGRDYTRFNYLGEWHSHPSFSPLPSEIDLRTMQSIVSDSRVGVLFAVLIIVRRSWSGQLQLSACAFTPGSGPFNVDVTVESDEIARTRSSLLQRIRGWFRAN
jgi:integrative and conjugative element protein (TIGR02256 family)